MTRRYTPHFVCLNPYSTGRYSVSEDDLYDEDDGGVS